MLTTITTLTGFRHSGARRNDEITNLSTDCPRLSQSLLRLALQRFRLQYKHLAHSPNRIMHRTQCKNATDSMDFSMSTRPLLLHNPHPSVANNASP